MFEKVLAGDRRRARQRTRLALTASVAAHTLVALGAAHVPLGPAGEPRSTEEVVSFMDLPAPDRPAEPAARRSDPAPRPRSESEGPRVQESPALAEAEVTVSAAEATPERLPDASVTLAVPVAVVSAADLRLPDYLLASARNSESREIVEADVLAERPRLTNRWEMERVWQELYPEPLERTGVTGETLVSFVIDESGRVIPESVELISASRREFGEAVLRGVLRLRFRPMMIGGTPVRVRTTLPVMWRLRAA
jgi:TonB family protein